MQISIQHNIDDAIKGLSRLHRKQVPFAASKALNSTAADAMNYTKAKAYKELDRPKDTSVNGIRMARSNKRRLRSSVFIIPAVNEFLRYQIVGGTRKPSGKAEAVPVNLKLNKHGNIPGRRQGKIQKLLNRPDTFSGTVGGVAGVWKRNKKRDRPPVLLVAYASSVQYKPRFKFYRHAARTIDKRWARNFDRALQFAIRTAR